MLMIKINKAVVPIRQFAISVLTVSVISLLISGAAFAQNSSLIGSEDTKKDEAHIEVSKVATSSTIITHKASFVAGFDASYSITGSPMNIKDSKDLIISSIVDDFEKSSTVGYIKLSNSTSNSSVGIEIANPFASNEQINQKIQQLVNNSIKEAFDSKSDLIQIKCTFGNSLDLFSCLEFPQLR